MVKKTALEKIIDDCAPLSKTLKRVGITGSFARGDFNDNSDVDLVFYIGGEFSSEATLSAGLAIKEILDDQFRRNLDIIIYSTILERKEAPSDYYFQEGYQKMYDDLIWLWIRE